MTFVLFSMSAQKARKTAGFSGDGYGFSYATMDPSASDESGVISPVWFSVIGEQRAVFVSADRFGFSLALYDLSDTEKDISHVTVSFQCSSICYSDREDKIILTASSLEDYPESYRALDPQWERGNVNYIYVIDKEELLLTEKGSRFPLKKFLILPASETDFPGYKTGEETEYKVTRFQGAYIASNDYYGSVKLMPELRDGIPALKPLSSKVSVPYGSIQDMPYKNQHDRKGSFRTASGELLSVSMDSSSSKITVTRKNKLNIEFRHSVNCMPAQKICSNEMDAYTYFEPGTRVFSVCYETGSLYFIDYAYQTEMTNEELIESGKRFHEFKSFTYTLSCVPENEMFRK